MTKLKTACISALVNIFEWYDYTLFGLFAQIIGDKFFPNSDPTIALLNAFMVFALGFLIRPIGGIIFGIIGDRYGRKVVLNSTVILMSVPTFIVGLLPTYAQLGVASAIIMVLIRLMQGLAIGGALTGSVSFIIEHTPKPYKGLAASIPVAGICVGILLGSIISYVTKNILSDAQFQSWGWRIPFLLAIATMLMGFYIRKFTHETPEFLNNNAKGKIATSPLKTIYRNHKNDIVKSIFLNATGSVLFYFQVIYITSYLKLERNFCPLALDQLINITYLLMAFASIFGGYCSDKLGRKKTFAMTIIAITILAPICSQYFVSGTFMQVIFAHSALSLLAAIYIGAEPALQCELYPSAVRNTALSLAYNVATTIFGGTTPYIMHFLFSQTGTLTYAWLYIISSSIASLCALYYYRK